MFVTQVELCKHLNISRPVHNRLRKLGMLPNPYPGVRLYWLPAVMTAVEANAEVHSSASVEPLPRLLTKGAAQ